MSKADTIREAAKKEERSKADWRPQETAPFYTVVHVAVRKGTQRCPGRPEMYVAPAWKGPTGWVLFGLPPENQRPGEVVEKWMPPPELPEGAIEADRDHKDHIKPTWEPPKALDIEPVSATTEQTEVADELAGRESSAPPTGSGEHGGTKPRQG